MPSLPQSADATTLATAREQIRALADEIAALASRETDADIFYDGLVENLLHALAAVGGAVWLVDSDGGVTCRHCEGPSTPEDRQDDERRKLIGRVLETGQAAIFPARPGASPYFVLAAPFGEADKPDGVVEILQRGDADPAAQRGGLRFLVQMCAHATEWSRRRKLAVLSEHASQWEQHERFVREVHQSLDCRTTAYAICNEGRELLGCDRVSLAVVRGTTCNVEAVSGQDVIEPRSSTVALLGKLAKVVLAAREPFWFEPSMDDVPPQIEAALEPYLEVSPSRIMGILPLIRPSGDARDAGGAEAGGAPPRQTIVGALIVEQFQPTPTRAQLEDRSLLVQVHAARALSNALELDRVFLLPVLRGAGRIVEKVRSTSRAKLAVLAAVVLAIVLGLAALPLPFDLTSRGTLEPVVRRDVFTMVGGTVTAVHVDHDSAVKCGQPLVELENGDLEVQWLELMGQRRAAQKELLAAKLTRSEESQISAQDRAKLMGRRVQLEEQLDNIDRQLRLVESEKERLIVRSPIDGRVATWDVRRRLMNRPVQVGEVLLTVVDPDQGWELELHLPERRLGHLQAARAGLPPGKKLEVSFVPAHAPGAQFEGRIEQVHNTAEPIDDEGNCLTVRASIRGEPPPQPRPGVSVIARIHCGTRAAGYVWFHEAWEWFEQAVFTYL
jgi:multidrug efflux pump subunit AcrA (membrane-fusion protein)